MEYTTLSKMLYYSGLNSSSVIITDYLDIINDYGINRWNVKKVLDKAKKMKDKTEDFDPYPYIVYGLIKQGKRD